MYRLILAICLISTSLAYCPAFIANEEACSCFSYVDGAVIKCVGLGGPSVVEKLKNVHTEIRELSIQKANIIEIGPRAFRNLRVKSLVLDHNKIQKIHADAFRGLEDTLQKLSITNNKLTEVPTDSISGLSSLSVLNLECNNIGDIYGSIFRNVSSLIELNLGCNQICRINGPAFDSIKGTLQSLILDQNCLKEIPAEALRNFESLLALHLQYNAIESIEKLQLMNLVSLLMIRLTGNRIKNVDRYGLTNVPNLRYLFLNQNQLTNIEPNVLQQFKYLEIVDLSYNNIAEITGDSFKSLEHLMQLNLEGNSIRDIAPQAFSNTPLLLLLLSKNCLSSINQQMFQGIPFLRQLSLADNNIRVVQPLSFSQLASLHMLDLSRNKLQIIQPGALTASPHVTVLLQENPVVCTQQGFHIVQGGQPIHLLNEKNIVCKTDYTNDANDVCPTKNSQPPIPLCCRSYKEEFIPKTTPAPEITTQTIKEEILSTIAATTRPPVVNEATVELTEQTQSQNFAATTASAVVEVETEATNAPTTAAPQTTQPPTTTRTARARGRDRLNKINFNRFLTLSGGRAPNSGESRNSRLERFNSRAQISRTRTKVIPVPGGADVSGRSGPLNRPNHGPQVPVIPRVRTRIGNKPNDSAKSQAPVVINNGAVVPTGFVDTRLRESRGDSRGGEVIQEGGRGDFQPNSGLPLGENAAEFPGQAGLPPWLSNGEENTGFNIAQESAPQNTNRGPNVRTLPRSRVSIGENRQSETPQKLL